MIHAILSINSELRGEYVTLEPLDRNQVMELFPVLAHKLVFASGFGGGLGSYTTDPTKFEQWAQDFFPFDRGKTFIVRIVGGLDEGKAVGTVSIVPYMTSTHRVCELGWSGFDPQVWGSAANAETKLLLLKHLFSAGCERVRVHADDFNLRKGPSGGDSMGDSPNRNITGEIFRLNAKNSEPSTTFYEIHRQEWLMVRNALIARVHRQGKFPIRIDSLD